MNPTRRVLGVSSVSISSPDRILEIGESRDVAAGLRQARNEPTADRIADKHEYDRNGASFLQKDRRDLIGARNDHVQLHADQLFREGARLVGIAACPTKFKLDIAALDPA